MQDIVVLSGDKWASLGIKIKCHTCSESQAQTGLNGDDEGDKNNNHDNYNNYNNNANDGGTFKSIKCHTFLKSK